MERIAEIQLKDGERISGNLVHVVVKVNGKAYKIDGRLVFDIKLSRKYGPRPGSNG